jgi:hypothetical protein
MRGVVCHIDCESIVNGAFILFATAGCRLPASSFFLERGMKIHRHKATYGIGLIAALAAFGLTLGVPARSASASTPWDAALASLEQAGFASIEEIELTADGGFEAEAFDAQQQEFEILIDSTGAIRSQRLEAHDSGEERVELAVAGRLMKWMAAEGYRATTSIGADDGHVEIETEDAAGNNVDLDVEPVADGFRVLRVRRHSRLSLDD